MITQSYEGSGRIKKSYQSLFDEVNRVLTGISKLNNDDSIYIDNEDLQIKYILSEEQITQLKSYLTNIEEDVYKDGNFKINTINEYFSFLQYLGTLHPRFIRLPLEEEPFTINLNKRTITTPTGNNVYAVTHDNHAETIYFKCNRYYETVDLGDASKINIIIQAECQVKNETQSFIFKAQTVDIDSDPGNIIFGWVIPREVTENEGTVKFAVRFYHMESPSIGQYVLTYSLSTLPTTIQVLKSFTIDVDDLANDKKIITTNPYLENYTTSGSVNIVQPQFNINGDNITDILEEGDQATFTIEMTSSNIDSNNLSYQWYRYDPLAEEENQDLIKESLVLKYKYIETEVGSAEQFDNIKSDLWIIPVSEETGEETGEETNYISAATLTYDSTGNTVYYIRENDYSEKTLTTNKYGYYGCKVTNQINRFSKETDTAITDYKYVTWPASIEFQDSETAPIFGKDYLSKYDNSTSKYILYDEDITKFKNIIQKSDGGLPSLFNRDNITLTTGTITFGSTSNTYNTTLTASHQFNESSEVTTTSGETETITILKPLKALTENGITLNEYHLEFTYDNNDTIGVEYYDNETNKFINDYANLLNEITTITIQEDSEDPKILTLEEFNNYQNNPGFVSNKVYTINIKITYNGHDLLDETIQYPASTS